MFCTQCGKQLDDAAKFCTSCGRPTTAEIAGSASTAIPYAEPRRLRRIIPGKKIAGVCAGFAEYFDMDVTLMRIIWLVLLFAPPGIGLIAYIVAWVVLPRSDEPRWVQP